VMAFIFMVIPAGAVAWSW